MVSVYSMTSAKAHNVKAPRPLAHVAQAIATYHHAIEEMFQTAARIAALETGDIVEMMERELKSERSTSRLNLETFKISKAYNGKQYCYYAMHKKAFYCYPKAYAASRNWLLVGTFDADKIDVNEHNTQRAITHAMGALHKKLEEQRQKTNAAYDALPIEVRAMLLRAIPETTQAE